MLWIFGQKAFRVTTTFFLWILLLFNILGWIYPWMDWTFSQVPNADQLVSDLLDFYGYLLFFCPVIAAIPGIIFKIGSKVTGSELKGNLYGLIIIMKRVLTFTWRIKNSKVKHGFLCQSSRKRENPNKDFYMSSWMYLFRANVLSSKWFGWQSQCNSICCHILSLKNHCLCNPGSCKYNC